MIPFFAFPEEIRMVIYTARAVESLHMSLRKIIKNRASFPNEESAIKLLYLALRNASAKWETIQHWRQALNRFDILRATGCAARKDWRLKPAFGELWK